MARRLFLSAFAAIALALLGATAALAADATPSPAAPSAAPTPPSGDLAAEGNRDRVSFGSSLTIRPGEQVRDVFCMGCSVTVEPGAQVTRDLVVFGGHAEILGMVGRDATAVGGSLSLGPKAAVGRDTVAIGGSSEIAPGAQVGRDHTSVGFPGNGFSGTFGAGNGPPGNDAFHLFPGIVAVVIAVLLLLFFPSQLQTTASLMEARPGASFGLGCLGVVAAVILAFLFGITVILLPVSLVISIVVVGGWLFGWAALYLVLGRRLVAAATEHPPRPLIAVVAGGAVFLLLGLVPVAGVLVGLIGGSVALGAALGSRFGTRTDQSDLFSWRTARPQPASWAVAQTPPPAPPPMPPTPPTPPTPPATPATDDSAGIDGPPGGNT